jgi:hypothetical protein
MVSQLFPGLSPCMRLTDESAPGSRESYGTNCEEPLSWSRGNKIAVRKIRLANQPSPIVPSARSSAD